jgi:hypothetical protein
MTAHLSRTDENDALLVAASVRDRCAPIGTWSAPTGYPDSLALCVIDSIQSVGVKYGSVVNVVSRYRAHRGSDVANHDGANELRSVFQRLGAEGFQEMTANHNLVSTQPGAVSKAEAICQAAELLSRRAPTMSAFRAKSASKELEFRWRSLPGQRSGITWRYLLMLTGAPGVKPDRMVRRFVALAVGRPGRSLSDNDLLRIVILASDNLGIHPTLTDHLIWRAQSGRGPRPSVAPDPGDQLTRESLSNADTGRRVHVEATVLSVSTRLTPAGLEWAHLEMATDLGPLPAAASPIIWARHHDDLASGRVLLTGDTVLKSDGRVALWIRGARGV